MTNRKLVTGQWSYTVFRFILFKGGRRGGYKNQQSSDRDAQEKHKR